MSTATTTSGTAPWSAKKKQKGGTKIEISTAEGKERSFPGLATMICIAWTTQKDTLRVYRPVLHTRRHLLSRLI